MNAKHTNGQQREQHVELTEQELTTIVGGLLPAVRPIMATVNDPSVGMLLPAVQKVR